MQRHDVYNVGLTRWRSYNIGIKHGFSCINIRQVPWEVLKTEAEGYYCIKTENIATFRVISCTILFRLFIDVSRT